MAAIRCPKCNEIFEEENHVVGRWGVKCPACGGIFENSHVKPALRWAGLWHPGHGPESEKCDTLADAMYGIAGVEHKPPERRKPITLEEYNKLESEEDEFTASWANER